MEERIENIKRMYDVMTRMNDEEIYMSWICLVPDCPSEDDIKDIAEDDEIYAEAVAKFIRLVCNYGHEGILHPEKTKGKAWG